MTAMDALAGQLAVQRQLISDATFQQLLARSRAGAGPVTQLLLRQRLLDGAVVGELISAVSRAQVLCPGCGATAVPKQLDPNNPLACPRCRTTLIVAAPGQGDTRPDSRSSTGRHVQQGSSRNMGAPFDTRRVREATGSSSARFGDPTGSMRFRHAMKEGGQVGPFEIIEELGRGGMGVVYKARHTGRGELVALKVLRAGALASKKQVKRFEREVQTMARLDHPNVVPVRDVGVLGENKYFTMALIDGRSLGDLLKTERLSIRRAAEIARDVARGLQHAHEEGIVHRDIKPDNVLLDRGGRALITDFGLVHDADADERLTKSGALVGTPYYMAPEQARGKRDLIGPRSDIHSLGVVLYQMLCGDLPFRGKTQVELIEKIVKHTAPAPSSVNPEVPRDLDQVVRVCLSKDLEQRYATAAELADDLERFLTGRAVSVGGGAPWLRYAALSVALAGAVVLTAGGIHYAVRVRRQKQAQAAAAAAAAAALKDKQEREAKERAARDDVATARQAALREPIGPGYRVALTKLSSALVRGLQTLPEDAALHLERGRVSEHLHLYDDAAQAYELACADPGPVGAEATIRLAWLSRRRSLDSEKVIAQLEANLARLGPKAGALGDVGRGLVLLLQAEGEADLSEPLRLIRGARREDPGLPLAWALEAQLLFMSDEPDEALTALERAIQLAPREPVLYANRGVLNTARGRMEEANADLRSALEIDPQLSEALTLRGQIRLQDRDLEGAIADFEAVHQEEPTDVPTLLALARALRLAGQTDRANSLLGEAERLKPTSIDVYRARVTVELSQVQLDRALGTLRRGISKVTDPDHRQRLHRRLLGLGIMSRRSAFLREYARDLEQANRRDARAYEVRGQILAFDEKWEEAEAAFRRGAQVDPTYEPCRENLLRVQFERNQDPATVSKAMRKFMEEFPEDPDALCYGVHYHIALTRNLERGRALAEKATRIAPNHSRAWETRALIGALSGNVKEAFECARRAVVLDPDNFEAHHILGEVLLKRKKLGLAISAWREALSVHPFKEESADRLATAYLQQGQARRCLELCQAQIELAKQSRREPPKFIQVHLANALIESRQAARAARIVDAVMANPPKAPDERRNLCLALMRLERLQEAKTMLQQLVTEDTSDVRARRMLQEVERVLGQRGG